MGITKEFESVFESISFALHKGRYKLIALVFGLASFGFLYYFLVAKVADFSIWISVMMSGTLFITVSFINIVILSALSGILFAMLVLRFQEYRKIEKKGLFGFVFSGIGAFGVGCPTCGAFLFGLIGLPLALTHLPFRGIELQFLGMLLLILSLYFTSKSIRGTCKIR